jgi:hypothetical protein
MRKIAVEMTEKKEDGDALVDSEKKHRDGVRN